jgi:hypothetical protein
LKGREYVGDIGVYGRILLKKTLKNYVETVD